MATMYLAFMPVLAQANAAIKVGGYGITASMIFGSLMLIPTTFLFISCIRTAQAAMNERDKEQREEKWQSVVISGLIGCVCLAITMYMGITSLSEMTNTLKAF